MKSLNKNIACLLGGAIGDALGAPIEFASLSEIREEYGAEGITDYVEHPNNCGEFTDDTQMTLFTADGLARAYHRWKHRGIINIPAFVHSAYEAWYITQTYSFLEFSGSFDSWLMTKRELFKKRAPGNTCLAALRSGKMGTMESPINNSKGCGGIMRVAPVGLMFEDPEKAFRIACQLAATTHGHCSGYLSAGFFASVISLLREETEIETSIEQSIDILLKYSGNEETLAAVNKAVNLAQTSSYSPEIIETLGAGWVAEEALAISLYCAIYFKDNFEKGVLASVNHSGDSDSTGSITGNLLGLMLGKDSIPQKWIDNLLYKDIVCRVAEDLSNGIHS